MSRERVQEAQTHTAAKAVFERIMQATNRHDLDAMVACFAEDYRSDQPLHPELNFVGPTGVRRNWSHFFRIIPDIQVDILNEAEAGDTYWAELHYHGTLENGDAFTMRGVMLCGAEGDQMGWARLYINPKKLAD